MNLDFDKNWPVSRKDAWMHESRNKIMDLETQLGMKDWNSKRAGAVSPAIPDDKDIDWELADQVVVTESSSWPWRWARWMLSAREALAKDEAHGKAQAERIRELEIQLSAVKIGPSRDLVCCCPAGGKYRGVTDADCPIHGEPPTKAKPQCSCGHPITPSSDAQWADLDCPIHGETEHDKPSGPGQPGEDPGQLGSELASAINRCSAENGSNTPDLVLGEFLRKCLLAFDDATQAREMWYGVKHEPGQPSITVGPGGVPSGPGQPVTKIVFKERTRMEASQSTGTEVRVMTSAPPPHRFGHGGYDKQTGKALGDNPILEIDAGGRPALPTTLTVGPGGVLSGTLPCGHPATPQNLSWRMISGGDQDVVCEECHAAEQSKPADPWEALERNLAEHLATWAGTFDASAEMAHDSMPLLRRHLAPRVPEARLREALDHNVGLNQVNEDGAVNAVRELGLIAEEPT